MDAARKKVVESVIAVYVEDAALIKSRMATTVRYEGKFDTFKDPRPIMKKIIKKPCLPLQWETAAICMENVSIDF